MKPSPPHNLEEKLRQYFGFEDFLPGQREAIQSLLNGKSTVAVFPTGGGKSLCYQLPAIMFDGLTLVVSPLIALMKDQIDSLERRSIPAARLDSSLSAEESARVMESARNGSLRLLYVAPERFNNERFRDSIRQIPISLFAVDEAHCISEWGHNFRPDYMKLVDYVRMCKAERTLALTATATPAVLKDICSRFDIDESASISTPFYRPNLTLLSTTVQSEDRDEMLLERLTSRPAGSTIVYVTLQKTAEAVAQNLAAAGLPAKAYHAGMKDDVRADVQNWFMDSSSAIVVATIAFGMGIDKSSIRYVYHYNLAKSLENYAQEIGRAGRDGADALCELFLCAEDVGPLENFIYGDTPTLEAIELLFNNVLNGEEQLALNLYELSTQSDIRLLVVKTLLTYLELEGYLKSGTPFYSSFQFNPLVSSQELLAQFDQSRRDFLTSIFRHAKKAKKWFSIEVDQVAEEIKSSRDRILRAFDFLEQRGLLEVKVSGVRHTYQQLRRPESIKDVAHEMYDRMLVREERDIERLQLMISWAAHPNCQTSMLGEHFGQPLKTQCGHCSRCLGNAPANLASRKAPAVDPNTWQELCDLRKKHELLKIPRRFACFACGITTPQLSKKRLSSSHPLFGSLADIPFAKVMELTE